MGLQAAGSAVLTASGGLLMMRAEEACMASLRRSRRLVVSGAA